MEYEEAWDERNQYMPSRFVNPKAPASKRFIKDSKLIINHLLVQNESLEDVSKAFNLPQQKLQECIRYYITRRNGKLEAFKDKERVRKFKEDFIAINLRYFLTQRVGRHTTVKVMVSHLKAAFEHLNDMHDYPVNSAGFINQKSVRKVLKTTLRYSWRANTIRAPKAYSPENVELRKSFPRLIST